MRAVGVVLGQVYRPAGERGDHRLISIASPKLLTDWTTGRQAQLPLPSRNIVLRT